MYVYGRKKSPIIEKLYAKPRSSSAYFLYVQRAFNFWFYAVAAIEEFSHRLGDVALVQVI